jgi:hypothetical protein
MCNSCVQALEGVQMAENGQGGEGLWLGLLCANGIDDR